MLRWGRGSEHMHCPCTGLRYLVHFCLLRVSSIFYTFSTALLITHLCTLTLLNSSLFHRGHWSTGPHPLVCLVSPCTSLLGHIKSFFFSFFFLSFVLLESHPRHMEVPRLGVQMELQLSAYTTATAMPDLSHVCDLHHSSQQHRILNPLSEARDRTRNLMVPSWIHFSCAMMGTLGTLS